MTDEQINRLVEELFPGDLILKLDGHASACLDICTLMGESPRLLYSIPLIVQNLMEGDGMDEEEAQEFFEFNIQGAYLPGAPAFLITG